MSVRPVQALLAADTHHAIEIADRTWWVGRVLPGDPFQCHAYLIENGDESVLIDPGGVVCWDDVRRKVEEVVPLSAIRWIVIHHQDPDITSCLPELDRLVTRRDAYVVAHWRAIELVKHYGIRLPFWRVEDHGWQLDLGDRILEFIFTPYMHFPGAFCSFDRSTGVLFSSDIFGGFTDGFSLVATDESYFESLRPFHEHYMPSREILVHGLSRLERLPIRLIAPQHGSLIPGHLVRPIIEKLKTLECGLYLEVLADSDVRRQSRLNRMMGQAMAALSISRDFEAVANALLPVLREVLPARSLEFYATVDGVETQVLRFGPVDRYRGELVPTPEFGKDLLGGSRLAVSERLGRSYLRRQIPTSPDASGRAERPAVIVPLCQPDSQRVDALAVVRLEQAVAVIDETQQVLDRLSLPLAVALEREMLFRRLEDDRSQLYASSIRDGLTGLYTRSHMRDTVNRFMDLHDRDPDSGVAAILFDIDTFKAVNDTFGHLAGDEVLRRVSATLLENTRAADLPVRYGGDELVVFLVGRSAANAEVKAERIRACVSELDLGGLLSGQGVRVSAGVAVRVQGESLDALLGRADEALYAAKNAGRDRVCVAP